MRHRWTTLGVVLVAAFMDLMDGTIVTVALPRIQADIGAGHTAAQWILAGYALTFALGLVTGGRLGDIHGRRRVLLAGVAGFVLTSAVCGAAWSPGSLIAGRLAQGVFAAIMVPQVMSVIVIMFDGRERVRAFGLYAAVLSLANVSGPLLGALLAQYDVLGLGWRAIFLVNVPIGVLAFAGAAVLMPESRSDRPLRLDLPGVVLISLACFALMFPIVQGQAYFTLLAAAPLLALFALVQRRRGPSALVPPELFRYRSFAIGLTSLLILFSGLASLFLVLTYHLQDHLGWSPMAVAAATAGWPIGIMLTSAIAQRNAATHGRRLIAAGLTVLIAGTIVLITVLITTPDSAVPFWHAALPVLGMGTGMGLCVSILTNVVLAEVPLHAAGAASGVTNAVIQLGTAAGIAVIGAVYFTLTTTPSALWYNVAAFTVALLLTPFLPRSARQATGTAGDGHGPGRDTQGHDHRASAPGKRESSSR